MCDIKDDKTAPYFRLERGNRQVDPISAYFFTLALEVIFTLINSDRNIGDLQFFRHNVLYSVYADDTTFFLRNKKSAVELINIFDTFFLFTGLNINKEKCEIAGLGVKKASKVAAHCGMEYIDLKEDTKKILGIYFYYNEKYNVFILLL